MPNIKSAKKRVKIIAVKSAHNQAYRSSLKTQIKKANIA
ncbi:MAG TPA: 30S ribosomal protein S20, partial [Ruminococcaceae bacterium]|nr:30S ribosomal protein S20 [Oscillospiraceae bacterium]